MKRQCPDASVGAYKTIDAHRCRCRCLSFVSEFVPKRGASVGAKLVPGMPIATYMTIYALHCARHTKCKDDRALRPSTTHSLYFRTPPWGSRI